MFPYRRPALYAAVRWLTASRIVLSTHGFWLENVPLVPVSVAYSVSVLTKLNATSVNLADVSVLSKWEALFRGLHLFISDNPVVFLCRQIKHFCLLNILNCVLVFKLSAVHCCARATISIQGLLYRYSNRQISVTIQRRIDVSNTALVKIQ